MGGHWDGSPLGCLTWGGGLWDGSPLGCLTYFRKRAVLAFPSGRLRRLSAVRLRRTSCVTWQPALRAALRGSRTSHPKPKSPCSNAAGALWFRSLAMTYSHMGKPHTTIGDVTFHFRVRDGVGWFHYSMVARQTGLIGVGLTHALCCLCQSDRAIYQAACSRVSVQ